MFYTDLNGDLSNPGLLQDYDTFSFQVHPSDANFRFRNNNNRNSARLPAGRGDEDCTTDFLLIPGGRGNITRYGELHRYHSHKDKF